MPEKQTEPNVDKEKARNDEVTRRAVKLVRHFLT
jgi:hypothetical protein